MNDPDTTVFLPLAGALQTKFNLQSGFNDRLEIAEEMVAREVVLLILI